MPSFINHIDKSIHNFEFLEQINSNITNSIDWQVTVCYYTALHLINAHLAEFGIQYRTHKEVQSILDPTNPTSIVKIEEEPYLKYLELEMLSRRARYMTHGGNPSPKPAIITEKHLSKCIRALDTIIIYFKRVFEKKQHADGNTTYSFVFPTIELECSKLKQNLTYITKVASVEVEN